MFYLFSSCCDSVNPTHKSNKKSLKVTLTTIILFFALAAVFGQQLRAQLPVKSDHSTSYLTHASLKDAAIVADADTQSVPPIQRLELDRITVTVSPSWQTQTPGAATYLGLARLQQFDYANVHRVLSQVGGVYMQEEDGFGLRPNVGMRGTGVSRSAKITLMEDGILAAPAPYSAPAAYYFPTMARMEGLEVRKGSSQIKYGPYTTGGALNLLSARIPFEWKGEAKLMAGGFGSEKFSVKIGDTRGQFGYVFQGLMQSNDGFKELPNGMETGFDVQDYILKLRFQSDSSAPRFQRLEVKAGYYDELSNETYLGLSYQDFQENPYLRYASSAIDQMNADQYQLSVKYFTQWASGWNASLTAYQQEVNRNWYKLDKVMGVSIGAILASPDAYPAEYASLRGQSTGNADYAVKANKRAYYSRGIQVQASQQWGWSESKMRLELGLRVHADGMDRFQWVDDYRMEEGSLLLSNEGIPGTDSNRLESAVAWASYTQLEWIRGNWSLSPGIRVENIALSREDYGKADVGRSGSSLNVTDNTLWAVMPGLGFTYESINGLNVFGGLHKGFAPPSPGSSEGTDSEQSLNYELGLRWLSSTRFSIESAIFYNDYSNLLGNDLAAAGGGGGTAQFNAGAVRIWGFEWAGNYDWLIPNSTIRMPLSLVYTLTESSFNSSFDSDYGPWSEVSKGDALPYLPKHQWSLGWGLAVDDVQASVNYRHQSDMRTEAGQSAINADNGIEGHHIIDVSMAYSINTWSTFQLHLRNALDTRYAVAARPAGYRPGLPRMLEAGIRLDF
jgi:Fe(3+) dicitrate transport protein